MSPEKCLSVQMIEAPQKFLRFNASFIHGFFSVEKIWQRTKVGNSDCSLKFHYQAHMLPPSFRVTLRDESDRGLGLCHVCFSILHQSICTRLKLKIQEKYSTKSGGGSSYKCRWSAATIFFKCSTDVITIESNTWDEDSVNCCLSDNLEVMAIEKLQTAPNCENRELQH